MSANAHKRHFHRIWTDHVNTFSALEQSTPQLKFHRPIATSSSARPGDCNDIIGYVCSPPDLGSHEASADFGPDPIGIWLCPFISSDSGDCDETIPATMLHDLTYQMGARWRTVSR